MAYHPFSYFVGENHGDFDPSSWKARKRYIVKSLPGFWGRAPERASSNNPAAEWTRTEPGLKIEKIRIMVESSDRKAWDCMPVYVLIPEKRISDPCPAVIVHHQHAGRYDLGGVEPAGINGDASEALGADLAKRGFIAVCPDALCFGERQEASEIYTAMALLMMGRTLNFKYIWDISRLIDYLQTRNDVDSDRIAIAGHSLGGQMAVWSAAFDKRIKAVVSNCGVAKIAGDFSVLSEGITHNLAFYLPGIINRGIDINDIAGLVFPRPFFLSAGSLDEKYPVSGVAEIHSWLYRQYAHSKSAGNFVSLIHDGGHMMPQETKVKMFEFLDVRL